MLIIVNDSSSQSLVDSVYRIAMDDNKEDIHLILTSTNNEMNETAKLRIKSTVKNVQVFVYPSNRKIEKHLILIQHITKYAEFNFIYLDLQDDLSEKHINDLSSTGIFSKVTSKNQNAVSINSKRFISEIVKKNKVNLIRYVFNKMVA